jgi:hypothetical protein
MTPRVLAACAGFLIAVLWIDLMFDVQALRDGGEVPEPALASIAGYYRRVTTESWPMGALIGAVMLVAAGGALRQLLRAPSRRRGLACLLIAAPVALALGRVFPHAVRLGLSEDPVTVQGDLAHAILTAHVFCLLCLVGFLALQLRDGLTRRPTAP